MANDYDPLELRIKSTFDAAGTNAAKAAQSDLNKSTSAGAKEAVAGETAVSDATKRLTLHKHDLLHIIRHIGREFPILAVAGRLALNPIVGIVTGLILVLEKARERAKELRET